MNILKFYLFSLILALSLLSMAEFTPDGDGGGSPTTNQSCLTPAAHEKIQRSVSLYTELVEKDGPTWLYKSNVLFEQAVSVASIMAGFGNSGHPYIQLDVNPETYVLNAAVTAFNKITQAPVSQGGGCTNAHYQVEQFSRRASAIFAAHEKDRYANYSHCVLMAYRVFRNDAAKLAAREDKCDVDFRSSRILNR